MNKNEEKASKSLKVIFESVTLIQSYPHSPYKMSKYTFLPELVLRTPAKAFKSQLTEKEIISLLKDPGFLETVFLASPSLYHAILDFNAGTLTSKSQKGVLRSAAKYIIRSHSRSTPFGLFAGTSTLKWAEETSIILKKKILRRTQLDFGFIDRLYNQIKENPKFLRQIKYFPNSTYYILRDEIRYLERTFENNEITFQISAIDKNDFLLYVLEKVETGLYINELVKTLTDEGVEEEDALGYIDSLIECQLLVNKLEPSLNAVSKLDDLINLSKTLGTTKIAELINFKSKLNQIDTFKPNNIKNYAISENSLNQKTFHTECFISVNKEASLSINLQEKLLEGLSVLNTLQKRTENNRLNEFKTRFKRRFGSQEVSLLIALDTEKGLGYGQEYDTASAPLIKDLDFPPFQNLNTNKHEDSYLNSLLKKAIEENEYEVKLENKNLPKLNHDLNLSASSSVLFRLISHNKLFLEAAGGSSAINLIGRFANSSESLGQLADKISSEEKKNNPGVCFAEIIHLPNTKLGNVLSRRSILEHEIAFLGIGAGEKTIALRNLSVFINKDKLFLKNIRTNEIIIPKLNCTHNVGETDLPVYKFLYDLQFQGLDGSIRFNWGLNASEQVFYPRVSYKGIILSLATWSFKNSSLAEIHKLKSINDFSEWHKKLKLPELFVISEGDNDLLIDTKSDFLIKLFIDSVKNKRSITLKEFLFDESQAVKNEDGKPLVNQFIATLIKSGETYIIPQNKTLKNEASVHDLKFDQSSVANNWLYLKLYAPLSCFDSIFLNEITEILNIAFTKNLIDKWFFIRLRDPDLHLRLRFHLTNNEKGAELVALFNEHLSVNEDIWKLEFDKYERELDRYAAIGIENAESIFHYESSSYINFIRNSNDEELRWLYGLKTIDGLLNYFAYSLSDKLQFITILRNGFAQEFGLNQEKKKDMDKLYRENRPKVSNVLAKNSIFKPDLDYESDWKKEPDFEKSTLAGLTHMCINRIMTTQPRLHELVIYDFLMRSYKSILAQQKKNSV